MISQVYWTEEYPLGKTYNVSTELPDKVDFVIIGSGYTGLTAAAVKPVYPLPIITKSTLSGSSVDTLYVFPNGYSSVQYT